MRIRGDNWIDPGYFFKIYWILFNKAEFLKFVSYFFRLFLC